MRRLRDKTRDLRVDFPETKIPKKTHTNRRNNREKNKKKEEHIKKQIHIKVG
jgi:hypothetical protein